MLIHREMDLGITLSDVPERIFICFLFGLTTFTHMAQHTCGNLMKSDKVRNGHIRNSIREPLAF
jgi:hypothetical protein